MSMKCGEFSKEKRLPRELDLAEKYNISRSQLREILAGIEREGFVTRIHGVGTLINHHVLQAKSRMDIEVEFMDMIKQNGYDPNVTDVAISEEIADEFLANKMKIDKGTAIVRISRICTADGKPAIYCDDFLEKSIIKRDYSSRDLELPIFHLLKKCCYIESYMDLTQIKAVTANEKIAKALDVSVGTPLLKMEEVDYDILGNIIFYSEQYFINEYFEQTVMRKKI